jgi:AraC-like DNA-binding protein
MTVQPATQIPAYNISDIKLKGFKIHRIFKPANPISNHGRRDFYKIGIGTGRMTVRYGDKVFELNGTTLLLVNPNASYSVVHNSDNVHGYGCLFTESFISSRTRTEILKNSPLFHIDQTPIIKLNKEQAAFMTGIFEKMMAVHNGDYDYKNELLKSCIELVIHEALRIQPNGNRLQHKNAATRITKLFMDLLERQFPIENPKNPLKLRTAQHFAEGLSVHVNYLNRSVKEVTSKPTSVHIAERIAAEAKALLLFTDWSVADIAYGLGFEYPTYFNNYFKRITGTTPNALRKEKV